MCTGTQLFSKQNMVVKKQRHRVTGRGLKRRRGVKFVKRKKWKTRTGRHLTVKSGGGVLGPRRMVKSKYVDFLSDQYIAQNTGSSIIWSTGTTWRANSVFDPRFAATGTFNLTSSAYKFWAALYNHYTVLRATIDVTIRQQNPYIANQNTSRSVAFVLLLDDDANASNFLSWEEAVVNPFAKHAIVTFTTDINAKCRLRMTYTPRKMFGAKYATDKSDAGAATGNNPVDTAYFMLGWQMADKQNAPFNSAAFSVAVKISYLVQFDDPKDISSLPSTMAMIES